MALQHNAMNAPVIDTTVNNFHPYNCHMAVMHWALLFIGETEQKAQAMVQKITRTYCPHCKDRKPCPQGGSLQNHEYAKILCGQAKPLNAATCAPGDVVIVPNPAWPSHSMVVVSNDANGIGIRGYNNTGTFPNAMPPPPFLQYDNNTRLLTQRISPNTNPVYQIDQEDFMLKMRNLSRMFSAHMKAQHF